MFNPLGEGKKRFFHPTRWLMTPPSGKKGKNSKKKDEYWFLQPSGKGRDGVYRRGWGRRPMPVEK